MNKCFKVWCQVSDFIVIFLVDMNNVGFILWIVEMIIQYYDIMIGRWIVIDYNVQIRVFLVFNYEVIFYFFGKGIGFDMFNVYDVGNGDMIFCLGCSFFCRENGVCRNFIVLNVY